MKLLIVAQQFPPSTTARAAQMGKVCGALAEAGVELRVVAGLEPRNAGFAETVVARAGFPVDFIPAFADAASLCGRLARRAPESFVGTRFARKAAQTAKKFVERWRPDALLTVSTPFASHRAGLAIRRAFPNLPWAVFFSDPFPSDLLPPPYFNQTLDSWFVRRRVAKVLRDCDLVFLTSRFAESAFAGLERKTTRGDEKSNKRTLAENWRKKIAVVPHIGGASALDVADAVRNRVDDINDFNESNSTSNDKLGENRNAARTSASKFIDEPDFTKRLIYTGSVGPERTFPELLNAVRVAAKRIPERFRGLLIFDKNRNNTFQNLCADLKMGDLVKFAGSVSPNVAFEIARNATCNLTMEANMLISPFFPSKFADCVAANRPILAISPIFSEISELSKFYQCCETVRFDTNGIADAIERIFGDGGDERAFPNAALRARLAKENVARLYVESLERIVRMKKRTGGDD